MQKTKKKKSKTKIFSQKSNFMTQYQQILAIIIGSGLLIIIFGWILLFIYYNTCGRPLPTYSTRAIDEEKTATSIDQNVQTEVEERENPYDKER